MLCAHWTIALIHYVQEIKTVKFEGKTFKLEIVSHTHTHTHTHTHIVYTHVLVIPTHVLVIPSGCSSCFV